LLHLKGKKEDLRQWRAFVKKIYHPSHEVDIAVIGKYIDSQDAYKSLHEAFVHAGVANDARVNIHWIKSEEIEKKGAKKVLKNIKGILIPGGFGERGVEGKICAVQYARENNIPFFGICLGMQCAVIEFARNVCGIKDANSSEFVPHNKNNVICLMSDQIEGGDKGGTMRLGEYECHIRKRTKLYKAYGKDKVMERHRHRFEFNNHYKMMMEDAGLVFSGVSPSTILVEAIELPEHPWFVAVQSHPEFKSFPLNPHPLFRDFVKASLSVS